MFLGNTRHLLMTLLCRADAVILGMGVVPATPYLPAHSGVNRAADGSISVDAFLHAGSDVFAAGDIASYPYWLTGERVRVEHWNHAMEMGARSIFVFAREHFLS